MSHWINYLGACPRCSVPCSQGPGWQQFIPKARGSPQDGGRAACPSSSHSLPGRARAEHSGRKKEQSQENSFSIIFTELL